LLSDLPCGWKDVFTAEQRGLAENVIDFVAAAE
jgi:hypothetical protein